MTQTLVVSVMALGASVVTKPWQVPLKLAFGFAVALVPALLALALKPYVTNVVVLVIARAADSLASPSAFWLWVTAGCGVFLLARRHHTPARVWH